MIYYAIKNPNLKDNYYYHLLTVTSKLFNICISYCVLCMTKMNQISVSFLFFLAGTAAIIVHVTSLFEK